MAAATFFTLLFFFFITNVIAQLPIDSGANFSCQAVSASPCDAYVSYIVQTPGFMSVGNISDLFGVSRDLIVESSNLESEEAKLVPEQLLLVPIKCGCNGTRYFSNITYEIKTGDSFYGVAVSALENLTDWHIVQDFNPSLIPTQLKPGTKVIFPLFCKCPSMDDIEEGIEYFITYVWQRRDQVTAVANKFNSSPDDIITENNLHNFSSVVALPVLIPVPRLPILSQPIPPKIHGSKKNLKLMILIVSGCAFVLIVLLASFLVYYYVYGSRRVQKGKKMMEPNESSLETSDLIQMKGFGKFEKVLPGISGYLGKPTVFENDTIMEATMNLDDSFKVGRSVYKAVIDGQILVVKIIKDENDEEMKILQRVNHANLVQLVGFSWNKTNGKCRSFLVCEYAENGSLNKWLYGIASSSGPVILTWKQRLKIALDVANGLQYLHEHAQPSIVHGDIRTKNILLDSGYKAKISNFSMSRHAMSSAELKSDVFGFGVVVLELLSGKKAMGMKQNGEFGMLWKDMGGIVGVEDGREERLRKWMDPNLEGVFPTEGAFSLVALATACVSEKPASRPSMAEIVFNLSVLMQSCSEVSSDKYWGSGVEMEDQVIPIIGPIKAR